MNLSGHKYRSEIYKIMGLSLMTPMGRLGINLLENGFTNSFFFDLVGSVILLVAGVCVIQRSYEIAIDGGEK